MGITQRRFDAAVKDTLDAMIFDAKVSGLYNFLLQMVPTIFCIAVLVLARFLAANPDSLILGEPTTGLELSPWLVWHITWPNYGRASVRWWSQAREHDWLSLSAHYLDCALHDHFYDGD